MAFHDEMNRLRQLAEEIGFTITKQDRYSYRMIKPGQSRGVTYAPWSQFDRMVIDNGYRGKFSAKRVADVFSAPVTPPTPKLAHIKDPFERGRAEVFAWAEITLDQDRAASPVLQGGEG